MGQFGRLTEWYNSKHRLICILPCWSVPISPGLTPFNYNFTGDRKKIVNFTICSVMLLKKDHFHLLSLYLNFDGNLAFQSGKCLLWCTVIRWFRFGYSTNLCALLHNIPFHLLKL